MKGRDFTEHDERGDPLVVVVNQAFARKYLAGDDPIGKRIRPGLGKPPTPLREIVGVVGDARQSPFGIEPDPIYYLPYKQLPWFVGTIAVRGVIPPSEIESSARAALASLDRLVPMRRVRTGADLMAEVIAPTRFLTVLMGTFSLFAVLLTVAGLHGLLSYMVFKRRREIGVRIALGATRADAIGLVWRRALLLMASGLILGTAGAVGLGRVVGSLVSGTSAGLPVVIGAAWGVMAVTGAIAAFVPAARAASVEPMQALRSE